MGVGSPLGEVILIRWVIPILVILKLMLYEQVWGPSASISCRSLIFNQNRASCFLRVHPSVKYLKFIGSR